MVEMKLLCLFHLANEYGILKLSENTWCIHLSGSLFLYYSHIDVSLFFFSN